MVRAVPDILARIVEHKRAELARSSPALSSNAKPQHTIAISSALTAHPPSVIGEIKKASPSKEYSPSTSIRLPTLGCMRLEGLLRSAF
jgi:indole-3-glycerol phosphate synthase